MLGLCGMLFKLCCEILLLLNMVVFFVDKTGVSKAEYLVVYGIGGVRTRDQLSQDQLPLDQLLQYQLLMKSTTVRSTFH